MRYRIMSGLTSERVGNELVVMLANGSVAVLNESAAVVFEALQTAPVDSEQAAVQALLNGYGLEKKDAMRDARHLLRQFHRAGLVRLLHIPNSNLLARYPHITRRTFVEGAVVAGLSFLIPAPALGGRERCGCCEGLRWL